MAPPKLEKVSYSFLHLFLSCPYSAFLRYEAKLSGPTTSYLALGNALHFALEKFHLTPLIEKEAELDFLFSKFVAEFERIIDKDEVFISFPQKKKFTGNGKEMLNTYYIDMYNGKFPRYPLEVEKEFSLDISGIKIVGKIDRINKNPDGLEVVDYKSGSTKPDPWFLRHNLQFTTYYWACKELYGEYPTKITWHHLKTGELISTERDEWDIEQLKIGVANAVKMRELDIRTRTYHEKVCGWCPYSTDGSCDDKVLEQEVLERRNYG